MVAIPATDIGPGWEKEAPETPVVELRGVSMDYSGKAVLESLDLAARRGEMVALLGPSGSGKTTVLRIVAGFQAPTAGQVLFSGRDMGAVPPHRRGIGLVFQSYALFPHMTVEENVAYGLEVRRKGRSEIRRRVQEVLDLVRLGGQAASLPGQLSGGQQQRVALARALAIEPEVLLLDEPLSNLDANLRQDVGEEIRRLQQATHITTIIVTHDRQEAFAMADRIAVLRAGRIEQIGSPREIYRAPVSRFMAEFGGHANLLPGRVTRSSGGVCVVDWSGGAIRARDEATPGTRVTVMVRPEDLKLLAADESADNELSARYTESFYYGSFTTHILQAGDVRLTAQVAGETPHHGRHETVRVGFAAEAACLLPESS